MSVFAVTCALRWLKKNGGDCDCEVVIMVVKNAGWLKDAWLDGIEKRSLNLSQIH